MRKIFSFILLIGITACTPQPEAGLLPESATPTPSIFFPQTEPPQPPRTRIAETGEVILEVHVHMLASSEGELVLADNCLWLHNSLIVWPANVSLHIEEGIPTIRDETGSVVARVGEWIAMGGGSMPHEHLVDRIRQQIPEACRRDAYWMAGPEITLLAGPLPTLTPLPSAGGSPLGDDALPTDAHSYAEQFGVSQTEALQRLRFQETIGELNAALMSEWRTLAGLWIEHEPVYQIVVAFTVAEGEEILQPYIAGRPFADYITVRQHRYTLVELEAAQREALT
ncbi:MAG: hypothetical protein R6X32_08095, partial [Chloroflexota bacterium]